MFKFETPKINLKELAQAKQDRNKAIWENGQTKINELRSQDFSQVDYHNLAGFLAEKDYFEQFTILENAIKTDRLNINQAGALFENYQNRRTKLALIENLPLYKKTKERQLGRQWLKIFC